MTMRPLLSIALFGAVACGSPSVAEDAEPGASSALETAAAAAGVEDVHQYDDCLVHGVDVGGVELGNLRSPRDPGTAASFNVASCIVGRLTKFKGQPRPYDLQSVKTVSTGHQTFFFQREFENVVGEAPSECLKVKLSFVVGATDVFVTIDRVKQLAAVRQGHLCSDAGET